MIVVFDLDNTLFDETQFIRGGFQAASKYLGPILGVHPDTIAADLEKESLSRRDEVFNRYLARNKVRDRNILEQCIRIYRYHEPKLTLYPEALPCIQRLKNYPLYVVTDGDRTIQWNKFLALGLQPLIKKCVCTDEYGMYRNKPSAYCFEKICEWEQIGPEQVVYVGDNPFKDFIGIRSLGFKTIRVLTGCFAKSWVFPRWDADIRIQNLNSLDVPLLKKLIRNDYA